MFSLLTPKLKIVSILGEGLNANVYKVEKYQTHLKVYKTFALKVLKRSQDINHFKTEFESLLQTTGPHLVKYRGWETYKAKPALLLEFINGVTLQTLFKTCILSPEEASWIYQESLSGLKELNQSGLFHGDLSPNNIMIDTSGNIKLIDFGLTHWRTKNIELTPEFAAPSVLNGDRPGLESDIISLDRIFTKLNLTSSTVSCIKPLNLAQKVVQSMNLNNFVTEGIPTNSPKKTAHSAPTFRYIKRLACALAIFSFVSPVTAQNYIHIEKEILVRSSKWLSVKSPKDTDWCYTPCNLTFTKTGMQTVLWKTTTSSGSIKVYVTSSRKPTSIDLSNLDTSN